MQALKTIQQYSGKRQRGMSVIGLLIVLSLAGFLAITAMKILPMYTQFFSVKSNIESLRNENVSSMSTVEIQKALQKRFDTGYVENILAKDMKIRNDRRGKVLDLDYRMNVSCSMGCTLC
jgi:Tfp pilus assembly protein PilE